MILRGFNWGLDLPTLPYGSHFFHNFFGDVEIGMNFLDVVMIVEDFHEFQHLFRRLLVELNQVLGDKRDFREGCGNISLFQRPLDAFEF